MADKIVDTALCQFYSCYGNIICENIREMCKQKQTVLGEGTIPYQIECPDLDPELTSTLECFQDTFDPKCITDVPLEEVTIDQSVFDQMQAKLKNICFLTKAWALPGWTPCFQCKKTINSNQQYNFWVKCIECDTFWCSKCFAKNEASEDNHKPVINKTVCSGTFPTVDATFVKCNVKFSSVHRRWNNPWRKCSRCLEWRCSICLIARIGHCQCTGKQREMPKFYDHPCLSGEMHICYSCYVVSTT